MTKSVSMFEAYKLFWKNCFNFGGSSNRSEYWFIVLWTIIIEIPMVFIIAALNNQSFILKAAILLAYPIICIIPEMSLLCRRLRDTGLNNKLIIISIISYIILSFVPILENIVGPIMLIITLMPSNYIKSHFLE